MKKVYYQPDFLIKFPQSIIITLDPLVLAC
jgi:hypothetical protein